MKYHVEIHKWNGDQMVEHLNDLTIADAEALVEDDFGDVEWADTQMGFQVWADDDIDFNMLFAAGGPILWEISMADEQGQIEEWDEELLDGEDHPLETPEEWAARLNREMSE